MKQLYLFLPAVFFLLSSYSFSQDSSRVKIPSDTASYYVIELNDGTLLKGKVLSQQGEEVIFRDFNTGKCTIKKRKIASIGKISSDSYFIFYMKDGSFLHGRIRWYNKQEISIETKNIGTKIIPLERVKEMRQIDEQDIHRKGKYWYPNMNAARYFFGPSAIPLEKGDGYFQNADLLVNNINYGITKNLSVQGGGIVPFAFFLMPKFGYRLNKNLHVGGGMTYAITLLKFRKTNYKFGAAYGMGTFGNSNTNLTLGMGYGYSNTNDEVIVPPKPILIVSGTARMSRRFALVTENVIIPLKNSYYVAAGKVTEYNYRTTGSFGIRFLKERTTIDFGFLGFPQEIFGPFVFADIVFRF